MNLELTLNKKWEFEKNEFNGGIQYLFSFQNGYGASVIKNSFSYGHKNDKWELAVLKNSSLCYSTPITDDVIGHLEDKEVEKLLIKIQKLKNDNSKIKLPNFIKKIITKIKCLFGFHDFSYDPYEGVLTCWGCGKTKKK